MTETLDPRIDAILTRLGAIEERLQPKRLVDHEGIAVVAGEGLRGGGTIEGKTRPFSLDLGGLDEGIPLADATFIFYSPKEKQHFRCSKAVFVESIIKASGLLTELEGIRSRLDFLEKRLAWLTIYERLEQLETRVEEVGDEVEDLKDAADEAN